MNHAFFISFLICLRFSNNAVVIPSTSTTEVALGSISSMEFCCSISPIETISKKKLLFLSKSNTTIAQGDVLLNTQTVLLPQGETLKNYKIELIEMNAQFNVKHNLAYYGQQQLFNSTGQFHPSPAAEAKNVLENC